MPLTITESTEAGVLVFHLAGRLDVATSPQLDQRLRQSAVSAPAVVDLATLEYVSSAGLRVLLSGLDAFEKARHRFAIAGATGYVREVFEVAGLHTVFDMEPDVATAVAKVTTPLGDR
jgi:anti-anti-sigma factor